MERWLCERRTVMGDPAAMKERLATETVALLQAATGTTPEPPAGDGSFHLRLSSSGGGVHKTVSAHVGQAGSHGGYLRIPISWKADPLPQAFPTFRGDIEIEDLDHNMVSIALIGRYRPPASVLGDLVDRIALGGNAEAVAERIVRGLEAALHEEGAAPPVDITHPVLVADVMTGDPLVLGEDLSLRAAANLMLLGRISGVPVVDEDGQLVGILSEADLLDKVAPPRTGLSRTVEMSWRRHGAATVGQACSRPARTTSVDTTIRDAAGEMAAHDVARLVVMRGATVAGILTRHDVLKALVRADEAIEEAVEAIVAESRYEQVAAEVADGHVRLTGVIDLRSEAAQLPERLLELDGVLDVDAAELRWTEDDVAVTPPLWY